MAHPSANLSARFLPSETIRDVVGQAYVAIDFRMVYSPETIAEQMQRIRSHYSAFEWDEECTIIEARRQFLLRAPPMLENLTKRYEEQKKEKEQKQREYQSLKPVDEDWRKLMKEKRKSDELMKKRGRRAEVLLAVLLDPLVSIVEDYLDVTAESKILYDAVVCEFEQIVSWFTAPAKGIEHLRNALAFARMPPYIHLRGREDSTDPRALRAKAVLEARERDREAARREWEQEWERERDIEEQRRAAKTLKKRVNSELFADDDTVMGTRDAGGRGG